MKDIALKTKPANIFLFLKSRESAYLSEIAKNTGTTYVYVTNLAKLLLQSSIITIEPKGKKRIVKLTEKGKDIAAHIEEIRRGCE